MIDPRKPDFSDTPVSPRRPRFAYAPRGWDSPVIGGARRAEPELVAKGEQRNGVAAHEKAGRDGSGARAERSRVVAGPGGAEAPEPLATIITAFHNTGPVFRETARSVLGQSLQAFEWIIVNDGSTDRGALAMLDEFRDFDPRVRVVDHPVNRGLSAARNTGFRAASTPYVYQLDSDDLIEPTALEKCVWHMHTHPEAAFVTSRVVGFQAQEYLWEKGFHNGEGFLRENLATPMGIVRRSVFDEVGPYVEENRGGMEDWEFWLRCAAAGHWGETIPEYLAWYRRRDHHWDSWANMRAEERRKAFHDEMMEQYEPLLKGKFPRVATRPPHAFEDIRVDPRLSNPLAKDARRLLLIVPWLTLGGADKFNAAMVRELVARGWEVTISTTLAGDNSWLPEFTKLTPDVFVAPHFLRPADTPAFLRYLIESRRPDAVMVSNSELGYHVIPYLRAFCPEPVYVDLSHMEEPWWKNGGHPRYGAGSQAVLDLNIVVSEHLREWQAGQGADPSRIGVCYVSACEDTRHWQRDPEARSRVRRELDIPEDQAVILYAGRIVQQKRPQVFARVTKELADAGAEFTCLVAGDGPDLAWLRWYVGDNALSSKVRLLGAVPHSEMHELMSASDIFFLPSMWEGVAISIYEAMSMELAVVGAAVGGQAELVTPECGVLVPRAEEEDEIREYLDALTALLGDRARRARMGRLGRERIRGGFEPRHMGDRIVQLLEDAERLRDTQPRGAIDASFAVECARRGVEYLRVWDVAEANHHETIRLWNERADLVRQRDQFRRERDELQAALNATRNDLEVCRAFDRNAAAQAIIRENVRYVAADRVNSALKAVRLQSALKALTIKVIGPRQPRP